jgi:hypothetical protein
MPADLDKIVAKLGDKGVQTRIQSAIRKATLDALKKEGIELSPAEWGELTARLIAAKPDAPITPAFDWGSLVPIAVPVLGGLLSDRRLKTGIVPGETRADGLRIYEFSFQGFATRWQGVIAQDVLRTHPKAVMADDKGYLTVNYNILGVPLRRVQKPS